MYYAVDELLLDSVDNAKVRNMGSSKLKESDRYPRGGMVYYDDIKELPQDILDLLEEH